MQIIEKVMVATDLSAASEPAGRTACALARAFRAGVRCLHVVEPVLPPVDPMSAGMTGAAEIAAVTATRDARQAELRRFAERYTPPGQPLDFDEALGQPASLVAQHAADRSVSLLVMGTHGRRGLERLLFGSTAEALLRHSPRPVITVRSDARVPAVGDEFRGPVLLASHFSPVCEYAANWAVTLAEGLNLPLEVIHVVELSPQTFYHGSTMGELDELDHPVRPVDYWQARLEAFVGKHISPASRWRAVIEPGDPTERILAHAAARGASLLCIGTNRHSALGQILGSTAVGVTRVAQVPVLTVRG